MKLVKLWGGLGNQMFQYSFGQYLKSVTKEEVVYVNQVGICDFSSSSISGFNCILKNNISEKHFLHYFNKCYRINRKALQLLPLLSNKILVENLKKSFSEHSLHFVLFDGYWQDLKFIDFNRQSLKSIFTPMDAAIIKQNDFFSLISDCETSVSVHIRRTDFLTSSYHNELGLDYYRKAILQVSVRVKNPVFFIFSDDIDWVKDHLQFNHLAYFVSEQNYQQSLLTDFCLMSSCKHHIIANSTFSWWAAWLNDNYNKIVVAPKNWYRFNNELAKRILPKEWITL